MRQLLSNEQGVDITYLKWLNLDFPSVWEVNDFVQNEEYNFNSHHTLHSFVLQLRSITLSAFLQIPLRVFQSFLWHITEQYNERRHLEQRKELWLPHTSQNCTWGEEEEEEEEEDDIVDSIK